MTQGFVTIATGDEQYYRLARTLLRSYRQNAQEPMRFAVIADRHNAYTEEFDDVVILEDPKNSWMDKLSLLDNCPYDENIFIDADCTVYRDINFFFTLFEQQSDFSCFGIALPLDATWGWFTAQAAQVYPIHFITHLHGISYFIRKGEAIKELARLCEDIQKNYFKIEFRQFSAKMADETIFALAMAVMNMKPVTAQPDYYCFAPCSTYLSVDYLKRKNAFRNDWDGDVENAHIIHWSNEYTKKARYRLERHKIDHLYRRGKVNALYSLFVYRLGPLGLMYRFQDGMTFCRKVLNKIGKMAKKKG